MKNYFYGINKTANIRSNYYSENRNILSSDNNKLFRYSSTAISGRQSGVVQKTYDFQPMDPKLTGKEKREAGESRINKLNEIIRDNPNIKMSPEAYKAIYEGGAFQAKIQLNAPDRRNLAITGALTLVQLGAALATGGNSGFNEKQAEVMTGRAQADADFVTKYGNKYNRGFMGIGAQFQDGNIEIIPVEQNEDRRSQILSKAKDAVATNNRIAQSNPNKSKSEVDTVNEGPKETVLSVEEHEKNYVSKSGSIEDDAYKSLGAKYLSQLNVNDLKGTGISGDQLSSLITDIERGKKLERSQVDQLRKIGFSIGQENGGGQGVVTSIVATQDNLNASGAKGKLARTATQDYLQMAVGATLLTQKDLDDANKLDKANGNSNELFKLFNKVEEGLSNGTDINGQKTGISPTGLKVDHLIGGQHITNLQYAVNERIRQNTDAAKQINDVINGKAGANISATTAGIFASANAGALQGTTNQEKAQNLQKQLASGNLTGVTKALDTIKSNIDFVRDSVLSVAGGLYSERNAELEASLRKTDGADNTQGETERDFFTGIKDLRSLVASRQSGGTGSASVEGGASIKDKSIAEQANGLINDFKSGKVTSASQNELASNLSQAFSQQLKANGVEASPSDVQDIVKAVAQGKALSPEQKVLYEAGFKANKDNKSIGENFLALVSLQKAIIASPQAINNASQTISNNSNAVSQASAPSTTTKPDDPNDPEKKLLNETFAKYKGPSLDYLTQKRLEREEKGDYGLNLPATKNKFQFLMRGLSDMLDQRLIKSDNGGDPKTLSDSVISKMLEIADQLLRKSVAQYSYGFADSASISTSIYNKGDDNPLSTMYNMTKAVGQGVQNGITQADKYTGRRDDEKRAEGEKLGLNEAMDRYKKAFDDQSTQSGKVTSQVSDITDKEEVEPTSVDI